MNKTLYLECNSGISGDMTVAALLDLGADEAVLRRVLDTIPSGGFKILLSRVNKAGIDCCDFNVVLDEDNHDHDMKYLHGGDAEEHKEDNYAHEHQEHEHGHEHEHKHEHEHEHEHEHGHEHRGMKEIAEILNVTQMTDNARKIAFRIFDILAQAESKAHGVPIEDVHFHEVGAIDSIVDIVSVAVCIDNLGVTEVIIPRLCEGSGTIRCQHGILPIPVPATANIVAAHGLKLSICDVQGEFVTPTGAAIAAALKTSDVLPSSFSVSGIGVGAGKRTYEKPSLLRIMMIESSDSKEAMPGTPSGDDLIVKLETNIDDSTGEELGFVMDLLFVNGARDVYYTPIYMKKNRPAFLLSVICTQDQVSAFEKIIFQNTTTIGIRKQTMERTVLQREFVSVNIDGLECGIKLCKLADSYDNVASTESTSVFVYPEYEDAARFAYSRGVSYREAYETIKEAYLTSIR